MRITSIDIAKMAGVSQTTVSRVLNNRAREYNISQNTIDRVWETANKYNYKINRNARSLVSQKSYCIGFAIRELDYLISDSFPKVAAGIIRESAKRDYNFSFCVTTNEDPSVKNLHYLKKVQEQMIDGLIIKDAAMPEEEIGELKRYNIPFVLLGMDIPYENYYCVINDFLRAGYLLTEHIASLGHNNIVICHEKPLEGTSDFSKGCQYGIKKFCLDNVSDVYLEDGFHITQGDVDRILENTPTAIICEQDHAAAQISRMVQERGFKIPEDLSIVGCGNYEQSLACVPPLTTIEVFLNTSGIEATRLLFDIMENKEVVNRKVTIPVELIVRRSTASPSR